MGHIGTTYQGKGRVCREVWIGQTQRVRALGGERPIGTATYGGKGFKERTRVSGERPIPCQTTIGVGSATFGTMSYLVFSDI